MTGRPVTAFILANTSLGLLALTLCLPAMPVWEAALGASAAAVQATYGVFVAAFALGQLVCGPASDRFGRRPVLAAGLALFVAASLACAAAPGIEVVVLGRAAQGFGACVSFVVGRALVQDLYAGADRTRVLAYSGMALGLSAPGAAVVGGWLGAGFGWRAIFLCAAAIGAALLALAFRLLPPGTGVARRGPVVAGYVALLRSGTFLSCVIASAGCTGAFYAYLGGAPAVLHGLGTEAAAVGWYVLFCSAAFFLGSYATSRLTAWPDRRLVAGGQVLCLGGAAAILAGGLYGNASPLLFAAPMLLVGFGHGLIHPPTLRGAAEVSRRDAGAAMAVSGALQQGAGALVGLGLTVLAPLDQTDVAALTVAATVCSALASLPLIRRARPAAVPAD